MGRIVFWPVRTSLRFIRRIFGRFEYRAPRWWHAVRARLQDELVIMQRDLRPLVNQLEEFLYRRQQSIVFSTVVLLAFGFLVGLVVSWLPDTRETYVSVSSPAESGHAAARGPDTLRLQFRAEDDSYVSVAPIEHAGDYVRAGIQLEPSLPGVWFWQGDSTLVFRPDQPWPLDQEFTVSLDESVIRPDMELAEDTITFDGPRFYAQIDELQYYIDPVNPDEKRITATIHFSHAINEVNASRFIELQCGFNDVVPIELFFKNNENAILVRSEIIPIPDENRECTLSLDAGLDTAFESDFKLRNSVVSELNIPGRDEYFQMESVETGIVENRLKQPERVLVFKARGAARPVSFTGAIEAYVLPLDRPAYAGQPELPEHDWSLDEMDDYILSQSEKITLEPVAQDNYATDQLSYRLHAPAGRRLYIHIPEGAPSETGYRLAKSYSGIFTVPEFPSNLFIMHEGSVLSLSGEKKLTVAAHDLGAVEISVERVLPDDINHLVSQSDGEFQNVAFYGHFNSRDISERFREVRYLQKKDPGEMQYFAVDFQRYV
ncbi:MAG: hypothetical protein KDK27_17495, partial [Leptospiraceae bacterium]|nr:hypothetical protein [Leptospiraceae bacterium]